MEKITKAKPEMWRPSIVGFGRIKYAYANGKFGIFAYFVNLLDAL